MKFFIGFIFLCNLCLVVKGQSVVNGDLEGIPTLQFSQLAPDWELVPFTDPACQATTIPGATPDLTSLIGPIVENGIMGNPYSGLTFMSGLHSQNAGVIHHEGIMQKVFGLQPDSAYVIGFLQSVVKDLGCTDQSGSWAVYLDNILIGITNPTFSADSFNSVTFLWEPRSLVLTATSSEHTIKFLPLDDDPNLTASPFDVDGCLRMGIDSIYIKPLACNLSVNLGADTTMCTGQIITVNAPHLSTFTWHNGSTSSIISVDQSGTYWVEVKNNGCIAYDSVEITALPSPEVFASNDTSLCEGQLLQLEAIGSLGVSFLWNTGDTSAILSPSETGTYSVFAISNSNRCMASDSVVVIFHPLPDVSFGNDTTLCSGQVLVLSIKPPGSISNWQDGSSLNSYTATEPGIFWASAINNGCLSSDTIVVDFKPSPEVFIGNDTSVCAFNILKLKADTPDANFLWSNGSTDSIIEATQSGIYWVRATVNGCSKTDSIRVNYKQVPEVYIGTDTVLCEGDILSLTASDSGSNYLWQDGTTYSSYHVAESGLYWVEATKNGCVARSELKVEYFNCVPDLLMPNVFTPNDDGVNDTFVPISAEGISSANMMIFNRLGSKVFESNTLENGWDGKTINKEMLPEGIYFYSISYSGIREGIYKAKGWVTILR